MTTGVHVPSRRPPATVATHALSAPHGATADIAATELDLRLFTPTPKPVPTVLAALAAIPEGRPQYIRTRDDPDELIRALGPRGIECVPAMLADGTWRTRLIRRPVPVAEPSRPPMSGALVYPPAPRKWDHRPLRSDANNGAARSSEPPELQSPARR